MGRCEPRERNEELTIGRKSIDVAEKVSVLVSQVQGQLYATSSKCTHYGAPLAKGVLANDGRVTCPWHGACFNVKSGDIEDAPGMDSLFSFPIEIEGDKVFVKIDEQQLKTNNRPPKTCAVRKSSQQNGGYVVVGGGAGGSMLVQSLRENGYDGPITMISSESYLPIDRTKLSKALIDDAQKVQLRDQSFYDERNVTVKLGVEAQKLDPKAKKLTTSDGKTISYEKLILSTGGSPRRLPLKGADLGNVFVLRTLDHTKEINGALGSEKNKNLVIIGGSWIGIESALASVEKAKSVHVVDTAPVPMKPILGEEVGKALMNSHQKKGIRFSMSAELDHFEPSQSDSSKVGAVVLKDGTKLPADLVILAVGVKPRTELLDGHVELNKDSSVNVDEQFRVSGLEDVYAIGDIANYIDGNTKQRYRIEHWNVASNMARSLAQGLTGRFEPFDKVPIFWSAQGAQLRYCGTSEAPSWEDVVIRGNPEELKFSAFYCLKTKVVAVASMGVDPLVAHCSALIRLNKMPSASQIKDGFDPLSIKLASL